MRRAQKHADTANIAAAVKPNIAGTTACNIHIIKKINFD